MGALDVTLTETELERNQRPPCTNRSDLANDTPEMMALVKSRMSVAD